MRRPQIPDHENRKHRQHGTGKPPRLAPHTSAEQELQWQCEHEAANHETGVLQSGHACRIREVQGRELTDLHISNSSRVARVTEERVSLT